MSTSLDSADVTMPQLGETVSEGTITQWLKAVGDTIAEGDPLFEVSTDKVDTEIPAAVSGRLVEILVPADATVGVGVRLAVIATGEAVPEQPTAPAPAAEPVDRGRRAVLRTRRPGTAWPRPAIRGIGPARSCADCCENTGWMRRPYRAAGLRAG